MTKNRLTNKNLWNVKWETKKKLVGFFNRETITKWLPNNLKLILLFKKYLKHSNYRRLIELGGASSKWLIYFKNTYGFDLYSVDYSEIGCEMTKEIMNRRKILCEVICSDIFDSAFQSKYKNYFDVAFSNGLVEHFLDIDEVIKAHIRLVKPGGKIIIIIPNFSKSAMYYWLARFVGYDLSNDHNLELMGKNFKRYFEQIESYKILFAAHYGPINIACVSWPFKGKFRNLFFSLIHSINLILGYLTFFLNTRWTSSQIIVVGEKMPNSIL